MKLGPVLARTAVAFVAASLAWLAWVGLGGHGLDRTAVGLVALCTFAVVVSLCLAAVAGHEARGPTQHMLLAILVVIAVGPVPRILAWWLGITIGKHEQFMGVVLGVILAAIPAGFEYLRLGQRAD